MTRLRGLHVWLMVLWYFTRPVSTRRDHDLHCSPRQYINRLWRKKTIGGKCSPFSPPISQDVTCSMGVSFQCSGDWEGCDGPRGWIGGFRVFQVDPNAEIYAPYCCVSKQVKVDRSKCQTVNLVDEPKRDFDHSTEKNRIFTHFRCKYIKSNNKTVDHMKMAVQECVYNTTGSAGPTKSAPAMSEHIDPSTCFDRFTRSEADDDGEGKGGVIGTVTVANEKECAGHCVKSVTNCNSYRFLPQHGKVTCTLRRNYVNVEKHHASAVRPPQHVPSLSAKSDKPIVNVAYGNRTSVCDSMAFV